MTGPRSEQDIERILRSTLADVAGTVRDADEVTGPVGPGPRQPRYRTARWAATLAAVATVAAIAAATALQPWRSAHKIAPIAPPSSSSVSESQKQRQPDTRSPTRPQQSSPAVRLQWWTTPIPAGYAEQERMVTAQFSGEQLIKNNDPERNTVGNGGGPAGVLVRRWTRGAFNATTVASAVTVRIGHHAGLFGATPAGLFDDQVPYAKGTLPTLAVHVAADQWVTLAGTTFQTRQKDELIRVAATVLSATATTPVAVPLRLTRLPTTLHILGASEDLDPTRPYGLNIDITSGPLVGPVETVQQTTDLHLQIWRQNAIPTSPTGGHTTADHRTGVLDTTGQAAYFPIGARLADIELEGPSATPAALQTVLANLTWSPDPSKQSTWYDATDIFR